MYLEERKLPIVISYYKNGEDRFTIAGNTYDGKGLRNFKIFTNVISIEENRFEELCRYDGCIKNNIRGFYYPIKALQKLGIDVTEDFIGDNPYGYKKVEISINPNNGDFVNQTRLEELKSLANSNWDFSRLIRLCEEINDNYKRGNFLSVGMIGRTILNHIPPIFKLTSFDEIANNYGGPKENKSFKKNMNHLNESLKNIADGFLHTQIRKVESLPNDTQIDFRQDLDSLLSEIIRISK